MDAGSPLRRPIPVARSILWAPPLGGGVRPAEIPFPIFLSQVALTAISEHVATPLRAGQGVLGFLLGDLCECPETNVSYLVIDAATGRARSPARRAARLPGDERRLPPD